jgi:hypothetical protein
VMGSNDSSWPPKDIFLNFPMYWFVLFTSVIYLWKNNVQFEFISYFFILSSIISFHFLPYISCSYIILFTSYHII